MPHVQDAGRLLAYAQLWCPATAKLLRDMAADTRRTVRDASQKLRSALGRSAPTPKGAAPPRSSAATSTRLSLSLELDSAALRFEAGALERHLCLTRALHLRTAAAAAAHSVAAAELDALRADAAARAAAALKRGADPGAAQVAELPHGDAVHAALLRPLLAQHRCVPPRSRARFVQSERVCAYVVLAARNGSSETWCNSQSGSANACWIRSVEYVAVVLTGSGAARCCA